MIANKNLIIVYEEATKVAADYLMQLLSLKDDKENGEIVGCPDGVVKAAIWSEKHYLDNLPQLSSSQYILFIGENKTSKSIISNIDIKYQEYTIRYGWLGTRGAIYLPEKGKIKKQEYEKFLISAKAESQKISGLKAAGKVLLFSWVPVYSYYVFLEAILLNGLKERKKISEQLYKYAVLHFYLNNISKFLNL